MKLSIVLATCIACVAAVPVDGILPGFYSYPTGSATAKTITVRPSADESYLPMKARADASADESYLPMKRAETSADESYLPMKREDTSADESYLPMRRGEASADESYLPM